MIDIELVISIHKLLIKEFGGSDGLRDLSVLESAVNRPFQTFDQIDLYPNTADKAAAIIESIVKNHPFIDGNKRTGYVVMRLMLMEDDLDIQATEDEKYDFVIQIADGRLDFEQIKQWIEEKLVKI
jgi:death-on-curing protein